MLGNTVTLASRISGGPSKYQSTPIPSGGSMPENRNVPPRILKMMSLYEFKDGSFREKCRNFFRQGKFMEDYEDNQSWTGNADRFFPTYHDLRTDQLRGYFTWRTNFRKGQYDPAIPVYSYIYLYELLNGIGAESAEEKLEKISAFEHAYLSAKPDSDLSRNIGIWKRAVIVMNGLDPKLARNHTDPALVEFDEAMGVLKNPEGFSDQEVVAALKAADQKAIGKSAVLEKEKEEGTRLYALLWRRGCALWHAKGEDLFEKCFGTVRTFPWRPFANAVYWNETVPEDLEYALDQTRTYTCASGVWKEHCYMPSSLELQCFESFLHEAERLLRRYLNIKRPLKAKAADAWAVPLIEAVLEEDRKAKIEAAKPKVTIRPEFLEGIRKDSLATRDSLLTEEEKQELQKISQAEEMAYAVSPVIKAEPEEKIVSEEKHASKPLLPTEEPLVPLEETQIEVLKLLLAGKPVRETLRAWNEMAELFADSLNEALFDEIGDIAVECRDEELTLIEDYREDVVRILGGI